MASSSSSSSAAAKLPTSSSALHASDLAVIQRFTRELETLVDDKRELIDVSLCALLAGGHVLLEDVPGVGKTTFIKAFAKLLGHEMSRVQFTSDLLPSDIVGVEAWNPGSNSFEFHRGPIFAQVLLADELNRASPRTQSALLEAMGESHVTIERRSYPLPAPFMVFASQNPSDSVGTFELPESQLDRFAARVRMGYPSGRRELDIFREARRDPLATLASGILPIEVLLRLQAHIDESHVSDRVAAYAKRVIDATRADRRLRLGVSTRGGVIWLRMAKALALVRGREHVIPDDLRDFAPACLSHRVLAGSPREAEDVIRELTQKIEPV